MNERIKEEEIGVYLYVACYNDNVQKSKAFIAVTKAMLFDEIAIEMENLGDYAVLFTSAKEFSTIKGKLNTNKVPYVLIDLGASFDLEAISGFIPDSKIKVIQDLTEQNFSKDKPTLKRILSHALEKENFELAAPVRDITKPQNEKN